eukprot:COSAG06_NODE_54929_length_292_cov_0.792746_1_plen_68_part_10
MTIDKRWVRARSIRNGRLCEEIWDFKLALCGGERRVLHSGGQATVLELLATLHCQLACSAAGARSSSL